MHSQHPPLSAKAPLTDTDRDGRQTYSCDDVLN